MPITSSEPTDGPTPRLTVLAPVATGARLPNAALWALLTKAGPLTVDEWRIIEACERAGDSVD